MGLFCMAYAVIEEAAALAFNNATVSYDGNNYAYINTGGGTGVIIANTTPLYPASGDLWWNNAEGQGQLYVYYDDGDTQQWIQATPNIGTGGGVGGSDTYVQFNNSGTVDGSAGFTFNVTSNNVSVSNTVFAIHFDNVSDAILKDNIQPLIKSIDVLKELNPVSFDWRNTGEKSYGLIAQEVEKIIPEIVHVKDDNVKTVSYIQLIPLLIQAINEIKQEFDEYKTLHP